LGDDRSMRVGSPIPQPVADAHVFDARGSDVVLGTFWSTKPCLLVLLRHFGCIGCSEQVTELAPRLDEIARAGVRTVLVGNGSPEQLAAFIERNALQGAACDAVTDPSLVVYASLGLRRSVWATFGPRALVDAARALAAGHANRRVEGDATQQGGVVLVDRAGTVRFLHENQSLGDHARASDVVEAVLRLEIESSDAPARV
jgi:peroxiredoxin